MPTACGSDAVKGTRAAKLTVPAKRPRVSTINCECPLAGLRVPPQATSLPHFAALKSPLKAEKRPVARSGSELLPFVWFNRFFADGRHRQIYTENAAGGAPAGP